MSKILTALARAEASLRRGNGDGGSSVSEELKALRHSLDMSQRVFAETYGLSLASLQTWESPAKCGNPDLAARLIIDMIKLDPQEVASLVKRTKVERLKNEIENA